MLTLRLIVAVLGLAGFVLRPGRRTSTIALAVGGGVELALGASAVSPLSVVLPLVAFIAAALTLASLVERAGLANRAAWALASLAGGRTLLLYALTCASC